MLVHVDCVRRPPGTPSQPRPGVQSTKVQLPLLLCNRYPALGHGHGDPSISLCRHGPPPPRRRSRHDRHGHAIGARGRRRVVPVAAQVGTRSRSSGNGRRSTSWRSVGAAPASRTVQAAPVRATGAAQVEVYWRTVTMATPSAARSAEAEYRRRAARRRSITMDSLRRRRSPWRRSEITSTSGRPAKCRDRYPRSPPSGRATMKRSRE